MRRRLLTAPRSLVEQARPDASTAGSDPFAGEDEPWADEDQAWIGGDVAAMRRAPHPGLLRVMLVVVFLDALGWVALGAVAFLVYRVLIA